MSQLIPRFHYTRNWEDPADFAAHQSGEVQNRKDIMALFWELMTYINEVLLPSAEENFSGNGGGDGSGGGTVEGGPYLPLSGGTMAGVLRLFREPQMEMEAATKKYVDAAAQTVVSNLNGDLTAIVQNAEKIELLAEDVEGNSASLAVMADQISAVVRDVEGNASSITETAGQVQSLVERVDGAYSAITQTASELTAAVADETAAREGAVTILSDRITAAVADEAAERRSAIDLLADSISLSVRETVSGETPVAQIVLKVADGEAKVGYVRMDGNVDISGELSADALYASYGEVANLAVDQLVTSRRVVKYLAGDTSDDNYLRAYAQNLEWVAGECQGGQTQASNPNGEYLYWPVDVSGFSSGPDGYPVNTLGERVYTTTAPTAYPVYVYQYSDVIKRSISFESVGGIYSPVDRFGAGNAGGTNRAWIFKTADGFVIRYVTPGGKEIGINMNTDGTVTIDGLKLTAAQVSAALGGTVSGSSGTGTGSGTGSGSGSGTGSASGGLSLVTETSGGGTAGLVVDESGYADVQGMRRVTALDFSRLEGGGFSETLDGGAVNTYALERDEAGRIVKVTAADGHETVVNW